MYSPDDAPARPRRVAAGEGVDAVDLLRGEVWSEYQRSHRDSRRAGTTATPWGISRPVTVRNRGALECGDTFTYSVPAGTHPERAVHVAVQKGDRFAEVIVWDTGEAEFGFGIITGAQSDEHHDLTDTVELDQLLDRFLARLETTPR